jgi:hypothetical protein
VVVDGGEGAIHGREDMSGGNDVEDSSAFDPFGVVEAESMRDAGAAVVADDCETPVPRAVISPTWSAAIARLLYAEWSVSEAGLPESPYPRRSETTTVCDRANAAATLRQIT